MSKKKKIIFAVIIILVIAVFSASMKFIMVYTAASAVKQLEGGNVYTMEYRKDYRLDKFLSSGGADSKDGVLSFVERTVVNGLPAEKHTNTAASSDDTTACISFKAKDEDGNYIAGRNFDGEKAPLMMLFTSPAGKYQSVSGVDLSMLGFSGDDYIDSFSERVKALAAPYLSVDGVNEKGVYAAVLGIECDETHQMTGKADITPTVAIRLILDNAADVDEAINLLKEYDMNSYTGGSSQIHIADRTGRSVVVSYNRNNMVITESTKNYQVVSNYYLYTVAFDYTKVGTGRFETVSDTLGKSDGIISEKSCMKLLRSVADDGSNGDESGKIRPTLYSEVFNLSDSSVTVKFSGDTIYTFTFDGSINITKD